MMALRILHYEQVTRHFGVVQRILSCERLMSSAVQPAVVVDGPKNKGNNTTAEEKVSSKILVPYRTTESNPRNHREEHLARFYTVPEKLREGLFKHGGFPNDFSGLCDVFTETCIMVRKPFLEIKKYIESVDYSKPTVRIVLYGQNGHGKSITIAHVLNYGFDSGFMLVHVPWVNSFMRRCVDASPSETKPGMMDVPINASAWLVHFRNQNSHLLKTLNLKTTKSYQFGLRDSINEGATLDELIEFGVGRAKYACDVVEVLLREVKQYSNNGLFKTMVVIDGFNGLFSPFLITARRVKLEARCTLALPFLEITRFDWCNGIAVLSVDCFADKEPFKAESHLPYQLLGKQGWEHLDPFIPVEVEKYNSAEVESAIDYYLDRRWLQHPSAKTEMGRAELAALCGGSPFELMKICAPL